MSADGARIIFGVGDEAPWAERRNCGCVRLQIGEGVTAFPCAGHRAGVEAVMAGATAPEMPPHVDPDYLDGTCPKCGGTGKADSNA